MGYVVCPEGSRECYYHAPNDYSISVSFIAWEAALALAKKGIPVVRTPSHIKLVPPRLLKNYPRLGGGDG